MLKGFNELYSLDITNYIDTREGKDDAGNKIQIPYLNWAKCLKLLHENGAESVWYTPLTTETGSYLFTSKEIENKQGRKSGCYFVKVEIHIDDRVFTVDYPLMNGALVVYDDTLNQLRISNAHARAFVKGVAIHTGLGLSLWTADDNDPAEDDLSGHKISAVKERISRLVTAKMRKGLSYEEVMAAINVKPSVYEKTMASLDTAEEIERRLLAI